MSTAFFGRGVAWRWRSTPEGWPLLIQREVSMPEKHNNIEIIQERDISVRMRDGVHLSVDVYRPSASEKYPVLFATSLHNKDNQGPDISDVLPPQPAYAPLWFGPLEAGDTRRFVANGYVHVIAQPRGSA